MRRPAHHLQLNDDDPKEEQKGGEADHQRDRLAVDAPLDVETAAEDVLTHLEPSEIAVDERVVDDVPEDADKLGGTLEWRLGGVPELAEPHGSRRLEIGRAPVDGAPRPALQVASGGADEQPELDHHKHRGAKRQDDEHEDRRKLHEVVEHCQAGVCMGRV